MTTNLVVERSGRPRATISVKDDQPSSADAAELDRRFPEGLEVWGKSLGRRGRYADWLDLRGIIVPPNIGSSLIMYITPVLARELELEDRVLLARSGDPNLFGIAGTYSSDRNGYCIGEITDDACLPVSAASFIRGRKLADMEGTTYYFYPVSRVTGDLVAIFDVLQREEMDNIR